MKKILQIRFIQAMATIVLLFIPMSSTSHAQEKVMASLTQSGALGGSSGIEKQIIFNNLLESLSTHDTLVSQKDFETALTQTFEKQDLEECIEDQCFTLIQQILQAKNLFIFNTTREVAFTQLYTSRVNLDSQLPVHKAFCEECSIGELSTKLGGFWMKLIAEGNISTAETKIIPKPKPATKLIPEPEPEEEQEVQAEESPSSSKTWHYVAVSLTVVSALMSYNAANSYNELSKKNSTLATQYANSSSSGEKAYIKSEYDSNAAKMKSNKSSIQAWDLLTLSGLGWEAYLIMTDEFVSTAPNSGESFSLYIPRIAIQTTPSGLQTFLHWNLRF